MGTARGGVNSGGSPGTEPRWSARRRWGRWVVACRTRRRLLKDVDEDRSHRSSSRDPSEAAPYRRRGHRPISPPPRPPDDRPRPSRHRSASHVARGWSSSPVVDKLGGVMGQAVLPATASSGRSPRPSRHRSRCPSPSGWSRSRPWAGSAGRLVEAGLLEAQRLCSTAGVGTPGSRKRCRRSVTRRRVPPDDRHDHPATAHAARRARDGPAGWCCTCRAAPAAAVSAGEAR